VDLQTAPHSNSCSRKRSSYTSCRISGTALFTSTVSGPVRSSGTVEVVVNHLAGARRDLMIVERDEKYPADCGDRCAGPSRSSIKTLKKCAHGSTSWNAPSPPLRPDQAARRWKPWRPPQTSLESTVPCVKGCPSRRVRTTASIRYRCPRRNAGTVGPQWRHQPAIDHPRPP